MGVRLSDGGLLGSDVGSSVRFPILSEKEATEAATVMVSMETECRDRPNDDIPLSISTKS